MYGKSGKWALKADDDAAVTLLRPRRWSHAFVTILNPFYIKSEVQLIYVQLNSNDRRIAVAICFSWSLYTTDSVE